jgi:DNA repair protein RecN (Recombination protein N)
MLTQIHISNLVTIKELQLEFQSGTTVITGETGAGKSILIDAIELVLGGRITGDLVRIGQEKADISVCFDITQLPDARAWLENLDLNQDENTCVIRRTIHRDGRSRSFINGMPSTLQPLRELSELLLQLHGQHENQTLLKSDEQRNLLDHYAGHSHLVDAVQSLANDWHRINRKINELQQLTTDRVTRSDFLKFQLHELEKLQLTPTEFHSLDLEHKQLAHAGELLDNLHLSLNILSENEEHNILQSLNQTVQALETVQRVNPKISTWIESLKNAIIQVSDIESELHRYLDHVELDPERLQWIEERIGKIFDLARKHKVSPDELYDLQQKLTLELSELETSDEQLDELTNQLTLLEKNYRDMAAKLSESRKQFAKKLSKEITQIIRKLSLPDGEFFIVLEQDETACISAFGLEKIVFQIKTNAGVPQQSLAKIASGGELSRISLAIHMATAEKHSISTLIFDEVDVGIGGSVAETVGKLLRRLGETHQVLCITHLPQVAAQGHHHIRATKTSSQHTTHTHIEHLSLSEKIQELARMLGGIEITKKTLEHAKEMLARV